MDINTYFMKLFYQQDKVLKMPENILLYNKCSIINSGTEISNLVQVKGCIHWQIIAISQGLCKLNRRWWYKSGYSMCDGMIY